MTTHADCVPVAESAELPSFRSTHPPVTAPLTAFVGRFLSVGFICQVESGRGRAVFVFVLVEGVGVSGVDWCGRSAPAAGAARSRAGGERRWSRLEAASELGAPPRKVYPGATDE